MTTTKADFDVLARLGAGSFGTVFKCRRKEDDLLYVIKVVPIKELTRKERQEAINEVQLLAAIDSHYIVRYYDSFIEEDAGLHIVMEYCNRGDLQALLLKAKEKQMQSLKEDLTWNVALQIILGLFDLHQQHILHRDLKTANCFLQKEAGQRYFAVKIGDLGVAKLLETSTAFAQTIVGTPYYLSPELCADQPYRDRSDCWALGVILFECCTLARPFEARNQCALIMKIIQAQVEAPPATHASDELAALILWLLQKDWKERPRVSDILCEAFIQELLVEHGLPLPAALVGAPVTHRLSLAKCGSSSSSSGGGGVGHESTDGKNQHNHSSNYHLNAASERGADWQEGDKRPSTNPASQMRGPAPLPRGLITSSTLSAAPAAPIRAIRGDRVRGPAHAKRQTSSKVLTRHQVSQVKVPRAQSKETKDSSPSMSASDKDDQETLSELSLALALSQAKAGDGVEGATAFRVLAGAKGNHFACGSQLGDDDDCQYDVPLGSLDDDDDAEYLRNFKMENGLATPSASFAAGAKALDFKGAADDLGDSADMPEYEEDFEDYDYDDPEATDQQGYANDSSLYETCREAAAGGGMAPLESASSGRLLVTPSWAIRDSPLSARGNENGDSSGSGNGNGADEKDSTGDKERERQEGNEQEPLASALREPEDDEVDVAKSRRLQEQERIFTLQSWISDIRTRLHDDIGGPLFNSLYAIVRSNINTNTTFLTGLAETDGLEYMRDIHQRLNDQLQTTLEGACRIVLQLKTLVALEGEVGVRVDDYLSASKNLAEDNAMEKQ